MVFFKIINQKRLTLLSIFLFSYVILNLLDGERGLISFYEKKQIKESLIKEKINLVTQLNLIKKQNGLLTETIDLDYLETLYRKKFLLGKAEEKIYINK
tara:strand:- start:848 stop:1144 length:297 start_codon:yes stop_codon:yes gene_type:complete